MFKNHRYWLPIFALLGIVLLGLILRFSYRCGLCNPDSYAYIIGAIRLNDDGIREYLLTVSNIYENRISIVLPLAVTIKLFALSELTIMFLPLFYALGTIIVVYFIGQQVFDVATGLLAALLVATIPLDVFYSSAVLPDSTIPFYVGLTLLCFILGQKKKYRFLCVLSGFFLFCAFQARATSGVLILPLLLVAWWSSKRDIWSILLPGSAFFALVFIYWGTLFLVSDDFFLQLKLLTQDATVKNYVGTGKFLGHFKSMFSINGEFGLLYLIVFSILPVALYKAWQDEAYRLPVITFMVLYLFFEFGSTTLTSYQPIWKLSRFLTILSVPVALMVASIAVFIFSTSTYWWRLATFACVATHLLLVITIPLYNSRQTQLTLDYNYPHKATFTKLATQENIGRVYIVHSRWSLRGQFYARLHGQTYQYQDLKNQSNDDIKTGDIIIYDPFFFTPHGEYELGISEYPAIQPLPEYPPRHWQLLFTVDRPLNPKFPVYVYISRDIDI